MAAQPDGPDVLDFVAASARQVGDMSDFRMLVEDWNGRMNLVGPSFTADYWRRHALDSAQLFHVEQSAKRWADVGSGAGLPGIILAILLKGVSGSEIHLIESIAKRVEFLREVVRQLDLPVVVHHARAESLRPLPTVDIVTARACAPLDRLLDYTYGFFKAGARGVFLKGRTVESELASARQRWRFRSTVRPSLSDPEGRLLSVTEVSKRG